MKKLLFLLFILSFYTANAQYDSTRTLLQVNGYGYDYRNGKFRGPVILQGGLPTMARKDSGAISYSGGKLHLFDGNDWQEVGISGGGSSDGIDSFSVVVAAYADTLQFWKADTVFRSYVVKKRNGLIFGCEVTAVNDTTFQIGTANYVVNGLEYNSSAGTILTNSNNDSTGRYLVLGVDDTGFPFGIPGSNAANPQIPALTSAQVGCATVYFPPLSAAPVINNYTSNVYNVGVDSGAYRSLTVLTDTTAIWCDLAGRCDTLRLRYVGPDGALSGLQVTQLTDSTFGVTSGSYQINSVVYSTLGDTVEIAPPPGVDSSRIDIIAVDTSGAVVVITGVAGIVAAAPDYDYNSQLPLTFILSSQDSVYQTVVVPAALWSLVGTDLTQAAGRRLVLNNGMRLDTINSGGTFPRMFSGNRLYLQANATSGTRVFIGTVGGNTPPTTDELTVGLGTVSATSGEKNGIKITGSLIQSSGTQETNFIKGQYTVNKAGSSGNTAFIKHSPTYTDEGNGKNYFINSSDGDVFISDQKNDTIAYIISQADQTNTVSQLAVESSNFSNGINAMDYGVQIISQGYISGNTTVLNLFPDSASISYNDPDDILIIPRVTQRDTIARTSQLPTFRTLVADTGLVVRQSNDTAFVGLPYYEVAGLITFDASNNPTLSILINTFPASAGAFSGENATSGVYSINSANLFFDKTKIVFQMQAFVNTDPAFFTVHYDYDQTDIGKLYFSTYQHGGTETEVNSGTTSFSIKQYK